MRLHPKKEEASYSLQFGDANLSLKEASKVYYTLVKNLKRTLRPIGSIDVDFISSFKGHGVRIYIGLKSEASDNVIESLLQSAIDKSFSK